MCCYCICKKQQEWYIYIKKNGVFVRFEQYFSNWHGVARYQRLISGHQPNSCPSSNCYWLRGPTSWIFFNIILTHSLCQFKQHPSAFYLSWCPFKQVSFNKINRIQCSKHKTIFECMWKLSHQNRAHRKVIQPAPIKATRLVLLCKQMHNSKQPNAQLVMRSKNSFSTCQLKYHSGASILKRLL